MQVGLALLLVCLAAGCSRTPSAPESGAAYQPVVLISIDGFRWDYLQKTDTPNLDRLVAGGVQAAALLPVFPTKTFPNHYSMATGLYPDQHGIVSNNMVDPEMEERFSLGNRAAVSDGKWWGGEPIWVTAEKQGQRAGTFFWPGTEADIQGIRPSYWKDYDGSVPNDERVDTLLSWLTLSPEKRPTFLTLYFSGVDQAGHRFGPDAPETLEAIAEVDAVVGRLLDGLEAQDLFDHVNLILVSDHGMAPMSRERVIFLDDYIALDRVDIVDLNPYMGLIPKRGTADELFDALNKAHPHLTVYKKTHLPARWHFGTHPRVPPIVGVADVGWAIGVRERFDRSSRAYSGGNHGYDPEAKDMHGLFIAHGPAFKQGAQVGPVRNLDLYVLMTELLHLTPAPNEGNLDNLRPVLAP